MAIALVKSNQGTAIASATVTPAFGSATTSGNLIVLSFSSDNVVSGTGTGWTQSANMSQVGNNASYIWWRISTGETTFPDITYGGGANTAWVIAEFSGADATPYDVSTGQHNEAGSSSYTTPTCTPTTGNRLLVASILGSAGSGNYSGAFTGWTNSFTIITSAGTNAAASGDDVCAGNAYRLVTGDGVTTFSSGAGYPNGTNATGRGGLIIAFKESSVVSLNASAFQIDGFQGDSFETISGATGGGGEVTSEDKWHQPYTTPTKRRGFAAASQQFLAFTPIAATAAAGILGWFQPLNTPTPRERGLAAHQQQSLAFVPTVAAPATGTIEWFTPLSEPKSLKRRGFAAYLQQTDSWVPPVGFCAFQENTFQNDAFQVCPGIQGEYLPLSTPTPRKPGLRAGQQQFLAFVPVVSAEIVTVDKWFVPWEGRPPRKKPVPFQQAYASGTTEVSFSWIYGYSDPVRKKPGLGASLQQFYTSGTTEVSFSWVYGYQERPRAKPGLKAHLQSFFTTDPFPIPTPVVDTGIGWFQPWSERIKKSRLRTVYFEAFTGPASTSPEAVSEDRWHQAWSEPLRRKRGLGAALQPQPAFFPLPIVQVLEPMWHQPWSLPTPRKAGLDAAQQRALFLDPFPRPITFTVGSWFEPLSEPLRRKKGLRANLQQFWANPSRPVGPEVVYEDRWHQAWSTPLYPKKGLGAWLHPFFTFVKVEKQFITFTMYALEQGDSMTGEILVRSPGDQSYADVSISEIVPVYANVSGATVEIEYADVSISEVRLTSAFVSSAVVSTTYADVSIVEV